MSKKDIRREFGEIADIAVRWCGEGKECEALLLVYMMMIYMKEIGYDKL
jgi:hypothetical protein